MQTVQPERGVITVWGTATMRVVPDQVELALDVATVRSEPQEALAEANDRAAKLDDLLRELAIPHQAIQTSGLQVGEAWKYTANERVRVGYRAGRRTTVRLSDPWLVTKLAVDAVGRAEASVTGPAWTVKDDHPARLQVLEAAAANARARAETLAAALGVRVGLTIRIEEPRDTDYHEMRMVASMRDTGDGGEAGTHPGEIPLTATVSVTFALA